MKVYLVCCGTSGAHEHSGVFSVWTTRDAAIAEGERLAAMPLYGGDEDLETDLIEISEVDLDAPSDSTDATWAPPGLREFKAKA